jgi:hypothetical protein
MLFVCFVLMLLIVIAESRCPESCHGKCDAHCLYPKDVCKPIICWNSEYILDDVVGWDDEYETEYWDI